MPCRGREIGGIAAAWSNGNTAGAWKLSGRDLSVFWRIFQWRATTFYCGVSFYTSWNADCYLCHPFFSESKVA